MLSNETKENLNKLTETALKAIDASDAVVEMLKAAGVNVAAYPAEVLNGIARTVIENFPDLFEKGCDILGINEHVTVKVSEPGAKVTGEIVR